MANTKHRPIPQMDTIAADNFWAKVDISTVDACWPWRRARFENHYGAFAVGKTNFRASRVAYFLAFRIDPSEYLVCHTCDNPPCCNPKHMFLGTTADNAMDMKQKGRAAAGDRSGRRLHPERYATANDSIHWPQSRIEKTRGNNNGRALITSSTVRTIRSMHGVGINAHEIHRRLNLPIKLTQLYRIIHRETWTHVE